MKPTDTVLKQGQGNGRLKELFSVYTEGPFLEYGLTCTFICETKTQGAAATDSAHSGWPAPRVQKPSYMNRGCCLPGPPLAGSRSLPGLQDSFKSIHT